MLSVAPPAPKPAPSDTIKRCMCGRVHDAHAWAALPFVGMMHDEPYPSLEMRNCTGCGSTLAIEVAS